MSDIASKLSSRKFWIAIAAALASIGTSIGGLATGNTEVVTFGVVCLIISQAIYSFCEAYVDGASIKAQTKTTTITATTSNASTVATLAGADKDKESSSSKEANNA